MARFDSIKAYIVAHTLQWLAAVIILIVGLLASKLSKRWLGKILNRSRVRDDLLLKSFFLRAISISIVVLAILAALEKVNVPVTSMIAGLGITGLILGFGLRDTFSNFAAGLLLLIYRPFRAGEIIDVDGTQGVVEELTIVNMQMTRADGVRVIMPNSKVWGSKIDNYSLSISRRMELTLKVRPDDVEVAVTTIEASLDDDHRILRTRERHVRVTSIADDAATLCIWAWTSPADFQLASADEYVRLLNRLTSAEVQVL